MRGRVAVLLAIAAFGLALSVVAGGSSGTPAVAQGDTGWRIDGFEADLVVRPDGDVLVTERITVDFGGLQRRGIFRVVPVRYPVAPGTAVPDGEPGEWWRELDVSGVSVSSPSAPADTAIQGPGRTGRELTIRIGDPDVTISGRHEYRLTYRVRGVLDEVEGAAELYWNVTGTGWSVPIDRASAVVLGAPVSAISCFAGAGGAASPCDASSAESATARFGHDGLRPREGLTVATRFAPGSVAVPAPRLERRWSLRQAFVGSRWAWPLTALTGLLAFGGVAMLLAREGRDRVHRGSVLASGQLDAARPQERRRGLLEPRPVPVEFRPPDGIRPGQLGLLIDERVDAVDISATIVDLAVRGYLTIEETSEKVLWRTRTDWTLRRTEPADPDAAGELLRYERRLLDGLFEGGDEVTVSELRGSFATDYQLAEGDLYDDAAARGWFARRPDRTRSVWLVLGVLATAAAAAALVGAVLMTRVAVAAVPLVLAGLVLLVGHRWMPRRTGRGSALLTRALGFREFVATADADRLRFAEAEGTFLPYLPYAVVFGETDRWAQAFADLGVDLSASVGSWYLGHAAFDAARFSSGLSDFSSSAATALSTVPSSSGGGGGAFSGGGSVGGGFGGGGGGSW